VHHIAIWQNMADYGVSGFVVGGNLFFFFAHYLALALRAYRNLFKSLGDNIVCNRLTVFSRR
jgi:hypothetical protein